MAFQYRFDRIMKISEGEKNALEQRYAELYSLLENQGKRLVGLMERKELMRNNLEQKKQEITTVSTVRDHSRSLQSITEHIQTEQQKYEQLRLRLEDFHAILLEKSIEVKKFEKLKEMQWTDHRHKEKLRENKVMDEKAALNFLQQ